jgi:signal transduction histidine kinase
MVYLENAFARYKKYCPWSIGPVWRAFFLALFLAVILVPYWWLIVQWSSLFFADPPFRFTFITTTFLLVLIIVDSAFLIRYYQIVRNDEYEQKVRELGKAEEALRLANKKLNLLASITRHDINNQLFSLMAYLELSKEHLGDAVQISDYIIKMEQAANAIERQIVFMKEYEDLGVKSPVWQDVEAIVRNVGAALPAGNIRLDISCPGLVVFADPLFEKVFYNLIDNSLHYGGDTMTAIRVTASEQGEDLTILYEDDGNGISADNKKQLFKKGFGKHTGLGLFLSREILSITGLTITENGEPGKEARFEITVPKGGWRSGSVTGNLPV